ncbi:pyrimidine/purine nucleoside phosphorylase [Pedobacter foliorum]|uniref:pyrimidine/purine nucleoside phosphorylase n=1 Tax=Pedobacter foliorum TaxID=2739058 RepID=UPI0015637D77|nr:pyrimidine/purine nucleoside phosphorylase [Pedobacter foliorum]NRF41643.1 pyrimidine/purine nucleoside phosphorylase [Pedobacter foliorum]
MSNSENSSELNESVSHNVYFEGKVQSLGLETTKGKATVGVMKKGTYTFSASSPEEMVIVSGIMKVKLEGEDFKAYKEQNNFHVAAGTSFDIICEDDVAYICYYG